MPIMNPDEVLSRHAQLIKFKDQVLKSEVDYGVIPGTSGKPTLLKAGAEKLCTLFGLTKRFDIVERTEDWSGKEHDGEPFFYYLYRCLLYRGDLLIAEADGSCNSHEKKYRYRKSERVCPHCGNASIIKGKAEYGGGWLCWAKKGGCGAKFGNGDEAIEAQSVGNVINPDVADAVNTMQKMAQKRALVAATLLAVNASEFFTQDVEDFDFSHDSHDDLPDASDSHRESRAAAPPVMTPAQRDEIQTLAEELYGADWKQRLQDYFGGWAGFKKMTRREADDYIARRREDIQDMKELRSQTPPNDDGEDPFAPDSTAAPTADESEAAGDGDAAAAEETDEEDISEHEQYWQEQEEATGAELPSHIKHLFAKCGDVGLDTADREAMIGAINKMFKRFRWQPIESRSELTSGQVETVVRNIESGVLKW